MSTQLNPFETDLRLLPNLEQENDRFPGSDLHTVVRENTGKSDLATATDVDNLSQALLLRFLTRKGAIAHLGHPEYGSNLYRLLGEPNNETNRNRAKLYVLEALAQESRIAEVLEVSVGPLDTAGRSRQYAATRMIIRVRLRPVGRDEVLTVTVPITLS